MDKEQLKKLLYATDALDEYATKTGNAVLGVFSMALVQFAASLDVEQVIPEPEKQYTLAEATELLAS